METFVVSEKPRKITCEQIQKSPYNNAILKQQEHILVLEKYLLSVDIGMRYRYKLACGMKKKNTITTNSHIDICLQKKIKFEKIEKMTVRLAKLLSDTTSSLSID